MRYRGASKGTKRLLVLFALLSVSLTGCFYRAPDSHQPEFIGTVTRTKGTPTIVRRNANYLIGVESRIYQGDIIQTDDQSGARIQMIDSSIIQLGKDSHLVIHSFSYRPGADKARSRLTFTSGALEIEAAKAQKPVSAEIRIETPLANIRTHGAGFRGQFLLGDKQLEVLFLKGKGVEVSNDQGDVNIDIPGFGTTVIAGGTPQVPVEWTSEKRSRAVRAITI